VSAAWLAGAGVFSAEVTRLAENSLVSDDFDGSDLLERLAGFDGM